MAKVEVKNVPSIIRFGSRQRYEHWLLMITFTVLAITGIVQRFSTVTLSQWVILGLGGIDATRFIHRCFAAVLVTGVAYHFAYVIYIFFFRHARLSMMPNREDFANVINELKINLGLSTARPAYGRYDFRQKFEYLGLVFGSGIIIVTGLFQAFPIVVTRILPGQVVAAAVVFHGNEATLAILTILVWHLYDVIFKPGIFPADTSIFTGRISRKRMTEEHGLELTETARD